MSRKLEKATEEDKKQRKRKRATKQTITRTVTPIGLIEANPGKLAALDQMMAVYLPLCQQYTRLFCTQEASPDKYTDPVFETDLSDRLHRVAIQQAADIAISWRTNRQAAYEAYLEDLADDAEAKAKAEAQGRKQTPKRKEPAWREWHLPELRVPVIQANANVVVVEKAEDSTMRIRVLASMRFHARSMNAYLYASQLGHISEQLAWAAAKQGMAAHTVRAAYSSQECLRCHDVDRANRPTQQTFKCMVCGYEDHADHKAAVTLGG